jgi:hypothetical protein
MAQDRLLQEQPIIPGSLVSLVGLHRTQRGDMTGARAEFRISAPRAAAGKGVSWVILREGSSLLSRQTVLDQAWSEA